MKTRSLTEGAMLGAITVVLTIIGEYLGLPPLIVPVPLIILVYRHGFQAGVFAALAAAVVSGLVGGHVFSGISIIIWGFIGMALGMGLREDFSFFKLILVGILSTVVVVVLEFLLFSLIFGENMLAEMLNMLVASFEQAMQFSEGLGVPPESLTRYEQMMEFIPFIFKWGLPALLMIMAVGVAFLNLGVVRSILRRLGDDTVPWVSPFVQWRIPSYFSIPLLFGVVVTVLAQSSVLPAWLQFAGLNVFIVFFHAYLVLGLSVVWHYFNQKKVPGLLRALFVFLLFAMNVLVMLVVFLGLTDNVFDFRKLREIEN